MTISVFCSDSVGLCDRTDLCDDDGFPGAILASVWEDFGDGKRSIAKGS